MKFSLILAALAGAVASSAINAVPPPQSQLQPPVKRPFNDDFSGNRNLPPVPPLNNLPGNQNLPLLNQNFPLKPFQGKLAVNSPSNQRPKFGSAPSANVPNHPNQDSFQRNQPSIEFSNGPSFSSQSFAHQNRQSQNFNSNVSPSFAPNRELPSSMLSFGNQRINVFRREDPISRFEIQQSSPDFKFDWRFRAQSADDRRYPQPRQSSNNFDNDFRGPRFFGNDFNNNFDNRFDQNNFDDNRQFGSKPRSFSSDTYESRNRFDQRPRFEPKQSQSFDNQNYPRPTRSFENNQRPQPERFQQFNQQNSFSSNNIGGFSPRTQTPRQDFFNPSQFDRSDRQSFGSTPSNSPSFSSQIPNRFDFYPNQQSSQRSPFFFNNDNSDFGFPRFNMMKSGKYFGPNDLKKDKISSFSFHGQSQQFQQTQPKPQSQHQPQVQPPHQSSPQTQPKPQFPSPPQPNQQQTPNIPPPKK